MRRIGYLIVSILVLHSISLEYRMRSIEASLVEYSSRKYHSYRSLLIVDDEENPVIKLEGKNHGSISLISPDKKIAILLSGLKGSLEVNYNGKNRISLGETDAGGYLKVSNSNNEEAVFISPDEAGQGDIRVLRISDNKLSSLVKMD